MKKAKKWFSLLLSLAVLLSITAFSASALAEEGDSAFQYELLEDGTAMAGILVLGRKKKAGAC